MSCSRGNISRTRPQKHQNKTAFKNNLHDTSNKTKIINSLEIGGVCDRCKEIIEWKIKFKKYKPLTAPRKCVRCEQKIIKHAYHVLCTKCANVKKLCPKCYKPLEVKDDDNKDIENTDRGDISTILKSLPERKRRTILRYLKKQDGQKLPDLELLKGIEKINLDDEGWSSEEDLSDTEL